MITRYLAQNVINLRHTRNLTQAALAKISGVPRSTITYIESGTGNPSLKNLSKLSSAFQVSIEALLTKPRAICELVRAADVPVVERDQVKQFKLLPDPIPGMEIDRIELEGYARMPGKPHLDYTKEYLTCLKGRVTVHVAGDQYELGKGDVLAFPGNQPHAYQNPGAEPAIGISVVVLAPAL